MRLPSSSAEEAGQRCRGRRRPSPTSSSSCVTCRTAPCLSSTISEANRKPETAPVREDLKKVTVREGSGGPFGAVLVQQQKSWTAAGTRSRR